MLFLLRLKVRNSALRPRYGATEGMRPRSPFGGFHLDHLRAKIRQHLAAVGAGDDLAEFQHAHALERKDIAAAPQSPRPRAMMLRWISEVPAPITATRESRKKRCIGYSMQ